MKQRIGKEPGGSWRDNPLEEKPICRDIAWKCARCDSLLGFVDSATQTVVRLKNKDSYVWVRSPEWVGVLCRCCSAFNEIEDERFAARLPHGPIHEAPSTAQPDAPAKTV